MGVMDGVCGLSRLGIEDGDKVIAVVYPFAQENKKLYSIIRHAHIWYSSRHLNDRLRPVLSHGETFPDKKLFDDVMDMLEKDKYEQSYIVHGQYDNSSGWIYDDNGNVEENSSNHKHVTTP